MARWKSERLTNGQTKSKSSDLEALNITYLASNNSRCLIKYCHWATPFIQKVQFNYNYYKRSFFVQQYIKPIVTEVWTTSGILHHFNIQCETEAFRIARALSKLVFPIISHSAVLEVGLTSRQSQSASCWVSKLSDKKLHPLQNCTSMNFMN